MGCAGAMVGRSVLSASLFKNKQANSVARDLTPTQVQKQTHPPLSDTLTYYFVILFVCVVFSVICIQLLVDAIYDIIEARLVILSNFNLLHLDYQLFI